MRHTRLAGEYGLSRCGKAGDGAWSGLSSTDDPPTGCDPAGEHGEIGEIADALARCRHRGVQLARHAPTLRCGRAAIGGADEPCAVRTVDRFEPVVAERQSGGQPLDDAEVRAVLEHEPARIVELVLGVGPHDPQRLGRDRCAHRVSERGPHLVRRRVPRPVHVVKAVGDSPLVGARCVRAHGRSMPAHVHCRAWGPGW